MILNSRLSSCQTTLRRNVLYVPNYPSHVTDALYCEQERRLWSHNPTVHMPQSQLDRIIFTYPVIR